MMHYYKFNIADWSLHTGHLSLEEESVYFRLVNHYYDTEAPIPKITQPVIRRLRLGSHAELVAIILDEFFTLIGDFWHHKRCDSEISAYQAKAETNQANGKKGGRPRGSKKEPKASKKPKLTQPVNSGNPDVTLTKNQELLTNNQEPLTKNQEVDQNTYVNGEAVDVPAGKSQEAKPKKKPPDKIPACPHEKIIDLYHEHCPSFAGVKIVSDARKKKLQARWRSDPRHQTLDFWETYFKQAAKSEFLGGKNVRDWHAGFDFLITESKFVNIIEGMY